MARRRHRHHGDGGDGSGNGHGGGGGDHDGDGGHKHRRQKHKQVKKKARASDRRVREQQTTTQPSGYVIGQTAPFDTSGQMPPVGPDYDDAVYGTGPADAPMYHFDLEQGYQEQYAAQMSPGGENNPT